MGLVVSLGLYALSKEGMPVVCFGAGLFGYWFMSRFRRKGGSIESQLVFFCGIIFSRIPVLETETLFGGIDYV